MDNNLWPSIDDFKNSSKNDATAILVNLVKNGSLLDWFVHIVGYVPTFPNETNYSEKMVELEPQRDQLVSFGKALGVTAVWKKCIVQNKDKEGKSKNEIKQLDKQADEYWSQVLTFSDRFGIGGGSICVNWRNC